MSDFTIVHAAALPEKPAPIVSIGAGGIVRDAHYPAYRKAGFSVAGLYDVDQQRAGEMAATFGVPCVYTSLQEAVTSAPPDAVFDVAVPASEILNILPHIPDGRGVLIQKPMGNDLAEARRILDVCHNKRLIAAVNFQLRYAPYVLAARSLIEQGAIGDIHDMEIRILVNTPWHMWSFFVGIPRVEILYHSIHYLDVIRAFLGEPQGVYARTVKDPTQPQLASTRTVEILDYGDSLRATVTANHGHDYGLHNQESYIKWEGTRGAIKARIGLLLNYPKGEPDWFEYCVREPGTPTEWQQVPIAGTWFPDGFIGTMSSLMRYMEGSSPTLPTSVDDAYKTMAVVEAAYQSNASGGTPIPA